MIVEPKYQINLGYIARVAKNFGINQINTVSPRAPPNGKTAIKYSKHARELMENAHTYRSFDHAVADCDIVVGTTGVWRKARSNFRSVLVPLQLAKRLRKLGRGRRMALVMGRDDIGLTKEELEKCDMITYIGTNPEYPVMNISHALSVLLFALTSSSYDEEYAQISGDMASRSEMSALIRIFNSSISKKRIRNKKAVALAFKRLMVASQPTKKEVHALMTALK